MTQQAHHQEISAGFDRAARHYDQEVGANLAMRYMRCISLATLHATFSPGQQVLEIGCGTGEEALSLGRRGIRVLATDLSPEMLALTAGKVAAAGMEDMVHIRRLAARDITVLINEYGKGFFDGAYSSFGPLNGEPDLRVVARALADLVRHGGCLVISVMNRFYPLETLWYLAHGHPRQAIRRWGGKTMAGVSPALSVTIPTWYYTPQALERAFPAFRRASCRALPLLLPPPSLAHLWTRFSQFLEKLHACEAKLADRWPFNALGDHFLMVLHRV